MDDMEQTKCQKCRRITRIHAQGRLGHWWVARHRWRATESVIDDSLLQAGPHVKHTLGKVKMQGMDW